MITNSKIKVVRVFQLGKNESENPWNFVRLFVRYSETISLFCSLFGKKKSKQNKKHNSEPEIHNTTIFDIFGHHHPDNQVPTILTCIVRISPN